MNPIERIKEIQRILGTAQDGDFGPKSQVALDKLKIEAKNYKETPLDAVDKSKPLIIKFLNCFEQGSPYFKHGNVDVFADGVWPGSSTRTKQITISYGLVETGRLPDFIRDYVNLNSKYSEDFKPYLATLGKKTLAGNAQFISLLKTAATDPNYTALLEQYYELYYYAPGLRWVRNNGFKHPLSAAVVIDSFLHSGGILTFLRNRFAATTADEEGWIKGYLTARKEWLDNNSDPVLKKLGYRPNFYLQLAKAGDWGLERAEYFPNGVKVLNNL